MALNWLWLQYIFASTRLQQMNPGFLSASFQNLEMNNNKVAIDYLQLKLQTL